MESSTYGRVTDWSEVIKKEARGLNNADLGEVQEVYETTVVTERGSISKEKFYLPKSIPHGYNGRILLFDITEEEAKQKFTTEPTTTASSTEGESKVPETDNEGETRVPVIEERLEVSKKESMEEATVIKEPLKETKTVEVQLMHEELIIEKRAAGKMTTTTTTPSELPPIPPTPTQELVQSKTEINIPLMREEVVVSKKPYVKEEIVIKKKQVTETKTVTEQITSEKVSVRNRVGEEVVEDEVKKQ